MVRVPGSSLQGARTKTRNNVLGPEGRWSTSDALRYLQRLSIQALRYRFVNLYAPEWRPSGLPEISVSVTTARCLHSNNAVAVLFAPGGPATPVLPAPTPHARRHRVPEIPWSDFFPRPMTYIGRTHICQAQNGMWSVHPFAPRSPFLSASGAQGYPGNHISTTKAIPLPTSSATRVKLDSVVATNA